MKTEDAMQGGWSPSHSIAMLLLATARAGTTAPPPALLKRLLEQHQYGPALRAEVVITAAADELETHYRQGGLRGVIGALQSHCRRLDLLTESSEKSKIIDAMTTVADAVTDTPDARHRVYAFPFAAAKVWKLDHT